MHEPPKTYLASNPPSWASTAAQALSQYYAQHGRGPKVVALGPLAIEQLRSYTGQDELLFGIPIECDLAIDGIAFRDESRHHYCECDYTPKPRWICARCNKQVDHFRDKQ